MKTGIRASTGPVTLEVREVKERDRRSYCYLESNLAGRARVLRGGYEIVEREKYC